MKTQSNPVIFRDSLISLDVKARKLTLKLVLTRDDKSAEDFSQEFNLDVIPYEMAMSVICSLINPQKK